MAESSRDFVARGELDFVLNARVVRHNDGPAGSVAEETYDGGVSAANDADYAAFGAARAKESAQAGDFRDYRIAVHGVFDMIARNENVAVDVGKSNVGDNEAVAVVMQHQAAANLVARGCFVLGNFFGWLDRGRMALLRGRNRLGRLAQQEAAVRKLLDEATLLESFEHLEQRAAVIPFESQGTGEILEGDGSVSNL